MTKKSAKRVVHEWIVRIGPGVPLHDVDLMHELGFTRVEAYAALEEAGCAKSVRNVEGDAIYALLDDERWAAWAL